MSLDVFLKSEKCPHCGYAPEGFSLNITHNLNQMADAAGLYEYLWHPEEVGVTKAEQLITPLKSGLTLLKADPTKYKLMNPANGWGSYETLVNFVEVYLKACEERPEAIVSVSR